jgi:lipopolysaccharide export system permease protein
MLFPLFVFIAVIFFTSKMALRSEVIAILASGTTYLRWLRPYIVGGIFLGLLLWFANLYAIPKANEIRSEFEGRYFNPINTQGYQRCENCFYKRLDSNTYAGIKYFDVASKSASNFFLSKVRGNKVIYNLRSDRIEWDTIQRNWKLSNVVERFIDSAGERVEQSPVKNIRLNLEASELRKDDFLKDKLTSRELQHFITVEEDRATEGLAPLKVELARRNATPYTVLLLTLIGAVIAGRRTRGGSGLHLAIGIIIASIYILSDRFSTVFAIKSDFHPVLAAWMPNLVFTVVGVYLYRKAPK